MDYQAQVGDTFTLEFKAVPMVGSGQDVCDGCAFEGNELCDLAPRCSTHDVIFVALPRHDNTAPVGEAQPI